MALATTFVSTPFGIDASRKNHQLYLTKIRSHAAKVSHRHRIQQEASQKSPLRTRFVAEEPLDQKHDRKEVALCPQYQPEQPSTPWSWTNSMHIDFFNCIEEDASVDGRLAIDFLVKVVAPLTASISEPFGMSNIYGRWMLEHMSQYQDVLHAIAAGMLLVAHIPVGNPPLQYLQYGDQKSVLAHKYAATSKLRARLALPHAAADDSAILTILFLALVEDATGNSAAHRMHLYRVASMVEIRGGIKNLKTTPWIKAAIIQALVANSLLSGYDGHIDAMEEDQEFDSPSPIQQYVSVDVLPTGFEDLASTGALSLRLSRFIARIAAAPPFHERKEPLSAVFDSKEAQFRGFLSSDLPLNSPDGPDGPTLEKAICLSLIRYLHLRAVGRGHKLCLFHSFGLMLTRAVRSMKVPTKREERRCFIWIWLMAVGSWSIGDGHLGSEGVELLEDLRKACPELYFTPANDIEQLGRQFLWSPILSKMVERNWD